MANAPLPATPTENSGNKLARRILKIVMICSLIAALIPNYSSKKTVGLERTSFQLGVPFSPWLEFTRENLTDETGTRYTTNSGIEFLSVSFLLLVIAGVADWAGRKLRPKPAS
jgi:hypothetical protein